MNLLYPLSALVGYLIGSVPSGLIIGKYFFNKDIREYGSHNLGGTNAGRVLGPAAGFWTIAFDILKCTIPMLIWQALFGYRYAVVLGLLVPFGHCLPVFAQFKGGKAVASSIGFLAGTVLFDPYRFFILLILPLLFMLVIVYITKYVSLGSMLMYLMVTLLSFMIGNELGISLAYLILLILIVWRHRANIQRLRDHTESKISW